MQQLQYKTQVIMPLLLLLLLSSAESNNNKNNNKEETEETVTEYSSAFINVSWVELDRQVKARTCKVLCNQLPQVLHTGTSETGRYSVAGAAKVQAQAELLRSPGDELGDHLGCTPVNASFKEPFVAIVQRGGCQFDVKVSHAVAAGASAVLIYDNEDSRQLQTVQVASDTAVPVVFTFKWKGEQVVELLEAGRVVTIGLQEGRRCVRNAGASDNYFSCIRTSPNPLYPADDLDEKQNSLEPNSSRSVMFVSISFIVLMMISLAWLLFYYVQRFRVLHAKEAWERKMGRQARRALNSVELVVVGEGGEEAECTVCLDSLAAGEETRRLPCLHVFHRKCIDHWLLTRRKCPLCNLNIIRHFGLNNATRDSEDSDEASVVFSVTGP